MPRKKKPRPDMTDRELFEALFPKPIREQVERDVELEVPEKPEENDDEEPIDEDHT